MRGKTESTVKMQPVVALAAFLVLSGFVTDEQAKIMRREPSSFGTLICSQFRYMEQRLLAEGGVCPRSQPVRTGQRCLSADEDILNERVRDYLQKLRAAAADKGCRH